MGELLGRMILDNRESYVAPS